MDLNKLLQKQLSELTDEEIEFVFQNAAWEVLMDYMQKFYKTFPQNVVAEISALDIFDYYNEIENE